MRMNYPVGVKIAHAELKIREHVLMLADECPEMGVVAQMRKQLKPLRLEPAATPCQSKVLMRPRQISSRIAPINLRFMGREEESFSAGYDLDACAQSR
jgi:hypothetical protein